jgi:hypothetical protein
MASAYKEAFDEGGFAWDDASNNRAFLSNTCSSTSNGDPSITGANQSDLLEFGAEQGCRAIRHEYMVQVELVGAAAPRCRGSRGLHPVGRDQRVAGPLAHDRDQPLASRGAQPDPQMARIDLGRRLPLFPARDRPRPGLSAPMTPSRP